MFTMGCVLWVNLVVRNQDSEVDRHSYTSFLHLYVEHRVRLLVRAVNAKGLGLIPKQVDRRVTRMLPANKHKTVQ